MKKTLLLTVAYVVPFLFFKLVSPYQADLYNIVLVTAVFTSTIINTITDVKWRYVDDEYVIPSIIAGLAYTIIVFHSLYGLVTYLALMTAVFLSSLVIYAFGAWSSGDITAVLAAVPILLVPLSTNPSVVLALKDGVLFIGYFAIVYFVAILVYGFYKAHREGKKFFNRPDAYYVLSTTLLVMAAKILVGPLAWLIVLPAGFISSKIATTKKKATIVNTLILLVSGAYVAYEVYEHASHSHVPYFLMHVAMTYAIIYGFITILSSTKNIGAVFSTRVKGSELQKDDVIREFIVLDKTTNQYRIFKTTLQNVTLVKANPQKYEIIVKPSSEGLSLKDVGFIRKHFPEHEFEKSMTIPIVPFILVTLFIITLSII